MNKPATFELIKQTLNEMSAIDGIFSASRMLNEKNVSNTSRIVKAMGNLGLIQSGHGTGSRWVGPTKPDPIWARRVLAEADKVKRAYIKNETQKQSEKRRSEQRAKEQKHLFDESPQIVYYREKMEKEEMIKELKKAGYIIQKKEQKQTGFGIFGINVTWSRTKTVTL